MTILEHLKARVRRNPRTFYVRMPKAIREAWSAEYRRQYAARILKQVKDSIAMEEETIRAAIAAIRSAQKEVAGIIAVTAPEKFKAFHAREIQAALEEPLRDLQDKLTKNLTGAQALAAERGIDDTQELLKMVGIDVPRAFVSEEMAAITSQFSADLITNLTSNARGRINTILNTASITGEPTFEVIQKIGANLTSPSVFKNIFTRAETIARTELNRVGAMVRQSQMSQAAQAVPKLRKYWMAIIDDRTRPSHFDADNDYNPEGGTIGPIPIDEPFVVGGEPLMFPRDPAGSAANTINCRCVSVPFTPDAEEEIKQEEEKKDPNRESILRSREEIRNKSVEYAHVIRPDGSVALNKTSNLPNAVEFTREEVRLMRGNDVLHNHPTGRSFSPEDVFLGIESGARSMQTVGRGSGIDYILRGTGGRTLALNRAEYMTFLDVAEKTENELRREFRGRILQGTMTKAEANYKHPQELWKRIFDNPTIKNLPIEYLSEVSR